MISNPELRRNIWLDFSIHRIVLTPIIIGLIVYLAYLSKASVGEEVAFYIACYFIFIWGPKLASETVIEEVNNNTWDFQRQSAISPWSMTLGKCLGSTLYTWYGAAISLFYYVILHFMDPTPLASTFPEAIQNAVQAKLASMQTPLAVEIGVLVMGGLLTQAFALLLSIQILPQIRHEHSNKTFRYFFFASVTGMIVTSMLLGAQSNTTKTLTWHHMEVNEAAFCALSCLIFLGWATMGLYRTFSKELQYHNIPWVWLAFNVFCMGYFSGFGAVMSETTKSSLLNNMPNIELLLKTAPFYAAFTIASLLCYFALFTDSLNSIRYRKLITRFNENNLEETLQQLPWWTISYALTLIAGILAVVMSANLTIKEFSMPTLIFTSILFMLRDILLLHYFFLGNNPKRAQSAAILYLALLWIIFPMLLGLLHAEALYPALLPSWGQNTPLALGSVLVQIGLLGFLCRARWQATWEKI